MKNQHPILKTTTPPSSSVRKRLLLIGPLPPPYAGPEIGTKTLLESEILNSHYIIKNINTSLRKSNKDRGKIDFSMMFAYIKYIINLTYTQIKFRPNYTLYTPTSATLLGWVRDGTTLIITSIFKTKIIIQFRGGHFKYFYMNLHPLIQKIIRWLFSKASIVLTQANTLKSQFKNIVPDDKLSTLYNSVSQGFYDYFNDLQRTQNTHSLNILFLGHLSCAKGYCDFLKVVPSFCRKYNVRFRFVGAKIKKSDNISFNQVTGKEIICADPDLSYKSNIQANNLERYLHFHGEKVHGHEKLRVFETSHIFVLPSYSEGFSMAVLEAMASGLPVITTSVGAFPEIIKNGVNGFLLPPGDLEALQEKLEFLIKDKNTRIRMGEKNREICKDKFLVESAAGNLIRIIDDIM